MALLQTAKAFNVPQAVQQALEFHRQGKLPQAEKLYADVLAVRPDYFDALHMLGMIKLQHGDLAGALRLMSGALQARPKSPEVLLNYGTVLNALGRHDEALVTFGLVLSIKRRSVEAYNNRGAVLETLGRNEEALADLERALEIKSSHVDALYNHGSVLRKLGRHAEALKSLDRVVVAKPNYAQAHNNRGAALESLERIDEALASYERALALDPNFVEALNNRGNALNKFGRPEEAVACYDKAAAINPSHVEVLNNRSTVLAILGRYDEALASSCLATTIKPNFANAQWNESLLRLRLGDYMVGFEKYEWRWKRDDRQEQVRTFPQPMWLGETPIAGKTIFIYAEQGFGDTIQFARYVAMLTKREAHVILEVQPPLKSLLSGIAGDVQVIGRGEAIPDFDVHCPLLTLPHAFRTELATIPVEVPYLSVPGERLTQWDDLLPKGEGLRVGLTWSGNATHKDDHNRSIQLARLASLFDTPNVKFVSLQKDLHEADAQILASDARVFDAGRQFGDFTDTAAAICNVDLVISVDTSVAHLAGALGKPVWVLLPFNPDWRWLLDRDDSPWYPTARLFRQPGIGDWDRVIDQLRQALTQRAA